AWGLVCMQERRRARLRSCGRRGRRGRLLLLFLGGLLRRALRSGLLGDRRFGGRLFRSGLGLLDLGLRLLSRLLRRGDGHLARLLARGLGLDSLLSRGLLGRGLLGGGFRLRGRRLLRPGLGGSGLGGLRVGGGAGLAFGGLGFLALALELGLAGLPLLGGLLGGLGGGLPLGLDGLAA